jgi:hypothetical protein
MLTKIFERVCVINLEHRRERVESFFGNLPADWPFQYPERYQAVNGENSPPPRWWKGGNGAWGCYRTHLTIIEECLNRGINSVLILEDDAICVENFREKTELFWQHLPGDWEMVYLGGQHIQENLRLPRKVNEWVYSPYNVNRTHCYGIRGRKMLESVYRHLHDYTSWNVAHHVDHYLGEFQKTIENGLYVPREWLVAQSEGQSDITCNPQGHCLFCGAEELIRPKIDQTGIAILGNWFGGTNMVAGVLFRLGLNLGHGMKPKKSPEHPATFEDSQLREICRNSFEEQWLTEKLPYEDRVNHLRHWAGKQCQQANRYYCGKHPLLSLLCHELDEAWNHPLFLVVERHPDECLQEMIPSKERWNPDTLQRAMMIAGQRRDDFIAKRQPRTLRIAYNQLKTNPEHEITKLCQFLDIPPSQEQFSKSVELVRASPDDSSIVIS